MEVSYACNLNNRFELFLDEENDPLDMLAKQEQAHRKAGDKKEGGKKDAGKKKGLSKTLVESVKTIAAAVDSNNPPARPLARRNDGAPSAAAGGQSRSEGGPRAPRRNDNPNIERRNNERNFEPRPEGGERPPRDNRGGGARGDGPRGPRFPRGEGGRDGAPRSQRGGQREFDRRSGDVRSGVKSVEKRGGQGAYNWGSATDTSANDQGDLEQQQGSNANASNVNQDSSREEIAEGGEEASAPAGSEVVEMTLEQWKKEQAAKQSKAEYSANIRKPNEGEKDDPKLKKATVIRKKKEEETYDSEEDAEESEDECEKMKKQLEQTLASQFHFADQRSGPPRGGRGPGRTGPGGPRFGQPSQGGHGPTPGVAGPNPNARTGSNARSNRPQHTPRVEDLNDFPSLAA
ncbi:plasminogen activator inhibitor 1 RNA-binding protein-like [Varroa jacobsoni]|uniref:Hyaluronan/mRNA-binding protein domain-containing protein n=1 Tax=Varroa destructor TaxID=109461 RepID=A0A7M7KGM9_VARDE|nr:plasminogen activator inhibitor 1 RNA-binding protein-like [Varroa destructor]XP_022686110.1 plasminogen activator inhibitor 1 RNA-binding protein-like [Varroa jacobsoni]